MNLNILTNFCQNRLMYTKMIFSNFQNKIEYIGLFGNSNPLYIQDWIEVNTQFDQTQSSWNTITSK